MSENFGKDGSGWRAFLLESPGDPLGDDDDLLWEIASKMVVFDPHGDFDAWVDAVRRKFREIKEMP